MSPASKRPKPLRHGNPREAAAQFGAWAATPHLVSEWRQGKQPVSKRVATHVRAALSLRLWVQSYVRAIPRDALPRKGTTIRATRALRWAGIIDVECDAHPWMHSKIVVFDHPYFATTDESGAFEVTDVPAGTNTLKVWHEVFGELEQPVIVRAGEATSVTIVFPATGVAPNATKGH